MKVRKHNIDWFLKRIGKRLNVSEINSYYFSEVFIFNCEDAWLNFRSQKFGKRFEERKEPLDKYGKEFTKTITGEKCFYSQLSYHETNDL